MNSSRSKSASTSNQEDSRAAVDGDNGIAVGGGGTVNITDEFPEEVGEFANEVLDVLKIAQVNNAASTGVALEGIRTVAEREQSSGLFLQDLTSNITPIVLIGGVVILGSIYLRNR